MPDRIRQTDPARALLFHARGATPFASANGELCASIPSSIDSRRVFPLRSAEFRDWLTANYYSEFERAPSSSVFRSVLHALEARARYGDFPVQKIDNRLSFEGDPFTPSRIVLNLANATGENVEIDSHGWKLATNFQHCFREFTSTLPLPKPQQTAAGNDDAFTRMAELFRLSPSHRARVLTWIAAAVRPVGPYPVLVLTGPAASGKSVFARALRALIDPSTVPLRRLPARDRELLRMAFQNWILAFDQVERIPSRISQALCAISSGDALEIAQPDFRDPIVFQLARPMILIAPKDETQPAWIPPRTLSNRTLSIDFPPIAAPRPEAAIWSAFEALRPALLGTLCNAVATALHRIRDIDLAHVARFSDCAVWAAAAAPALGLEVPAILEALRDPNSMWTGSDPLRAAIHALLDQSPVWTGDATAFLSQLRAAVPFAPLPTTPKGLSQLLTRFPELRVTRSRGTQGQRILSIEKITGAPQTATNDASVLFRED
jgi:hypothetical protein